MLKATSRLDCKDVSRFLLWLSAHVSEHTRPALIRTLAQDWWNGANIDSIWARQITPPSCVLSLSLSFTLAQFPSNLPLPLSLTFPFIPFSAAAFLFTPFVSLSVTLSLSSPLEASQAVSTVRSGLSSFSAELGAFIEIIYGSMWS